ncbi:MAG: lipid-A-disaccharide synthase N-terminal domain-containing protein [Phycisphaerae bacterium]|nr:lipid-A-disaccharide synthase N-terminal domain-containing protein [Phycisphaerae bacterium]
MLASLNIGNYSVSELTWIGIGFLGQAVFCMRFVVQWIASERRKRSYIPVIFWYLSIVGSAILLAYAIYRLDPVFIAGQSLNMVIYVRNIYLIQFREGRKMGFKFGGSESREEPSDNSDVK